MQFRFVHCIKLYCIIAIVPSVPFICSSKQLVSSCCASSMFPSIGRTNNMLLRASMLLQASGVLMSLTAGVAAANSVPRSPFQRAASEGPAVVAASPPASASIKSSGKGSKITACSLAIMGLQHLPGHAGTSKQIMTAVESDPMLAKDLNW